MDRFIAKTGTAACVSPYLAYITDGKVVKFLNRNKIYGTRRGVTVGKMWKKLTPRVKANYAAKAKTIKKVPRARQIWSSFQMFTMTKKLRLQDAAVQWKAIGEIGRNKWKAHAAKLTRTRRVSRAEIVRLKQLKTNKTPNAFAKYIAKNKKAFRGNDVATTMQKLAKSYKSGRK